MLNSKWTNLIFICLLITLFTRCEACTIKAVIFDCDGTLIDNGRGYFLDWQYALRQQGYELNEEEFWQFMTRNKLVGHARADEVIVTYCCGLLGRDCHEALLKDKQTFSKKLHASGNFPAILGTLNFLRRLASEKEKLGIKIGLASGGEKERILRILKRLQIDHYFDVIVSGTDDLQDYHDSEGTNKPKPYVYFHAAQLLHLSPEQCIAIEDSFTGIISAVDAGCCAVAIPNAYTQHQDFGMAHLILPTFEGITPAAFLELIDGAWSKEKNDLIEMKKNPKT